VIRKPAARLPRTLKLMEALSGGHELGVSRSLPGGPSSAQHGAPPTQHAGRAGYVQRNPDAGTYMLAHRLLYLARLDA